MRRMHLALLVALVVADAVMSIVMSQTLPARVPAHWNIHGEVDRYGPSSELTVFFPFFIAAQAVLMAGVATIKPVGRAFGPVAIAVVGMFVGVHAVALLNAAGKPIAVVPSILVLLAVMLGVMGNSLGKIRRNQLFGIRTTWTLKNDVVWERTHRVGGRLMVTHALAVAAAAIWLPAWAGFAILIGGLALVCAWSTIYSWRLHRSLVAMQSSA